MIAFGPVPSRRLGSSLGINHIPPKHCTYSCVYCQVGRTTCMEIERRQYYPLEKVLADVGEKIDQCLHAGIDIDYLTLVPDGEPTLDVNLGSLIKGLKEYKIPVAVISNGSLIHHPGVREELLAADWVSLKVDAIDETIWKKIDRPHGNLSLSKILAGMVDFRRIFGGQLVTETMLVSGINDAQGDILRLCDFLSALKPEISYLSLPTRPPAEAEVKSPGSEKLREALTIFADRVPFMEMLFEAESGDFISTGSLAEDILAITAVHPLRKSALQKMVAKAGENWQVVEDLLASKKITSILYHDEQFFLRDIKYNTSYRRTKQPE